jgi:four helix bundle protein
LPIKSSGRTIANQAARSACSVASNYRADFIDKITTVLEEAGETSFWIELTTLAGLLPSGRLAKLLAEAKN